MKGIRGEMSHSDTKSKVGRFAGISGLDKTTTRPFLRRKRDTAQLFEHIRREHGNFVIEIFNLHEQLRQAIHLRTLEAYFVLLDRDLKFRQDSVEAYFVLLERDLKFRQDSVEAYFVLLERDLKLRQDSEARNAII
ncbi:hypothetical protein TNCV_1751661 [Trichonephila clavipes]|nr:hypothetical protein TNCV_1751661 [Trichonephila clavipes]